MSIARSALRPLVLDYLGYGEFQRRAATSAGAAGGTTTVDSALARYPNDRFNNWWEVLTLGASGVGSYEFVLASDFVSSTGTITHNATSGATQVASTAAFELLPPWIHPTFLHTTLNQVLEDKFPWLYVPKKDETLAVDNLLLNFSFEAGTFTSWTTVGSPTVTANTSIYKHETQAANIVAGGSAGQLTQAPQLNIKEMTGKTAYLEAWVYATAASTARIRLDWDGTNFENHAYHSGADQWEYQKLSLAIPSTATQVKAIVEAAASGTARFDAARLWTSEHIYRYTIPSGITHGPYHLSMQHDEDIPNGIYDPVPAAYYEVIPDGETRYLMLKRPLTPGRILRLEGKGPLSIFSLTSDTGTTELSSPRTRLAAAMTALEIARACSEEKAKVQGLEKTVDEMLRQPGMVVYGQSAPLSFHPGWGRGRGI